MDDDDEEDGEEEEEEVEEEEEEDNDDDDDDLLPFLSIQLSSASCLASSSLDIHISAYLQAADNIPYCISPTTTLYVCIIR